jgi:hypothetical protein
MSAHTVPSQGLFYQEAWVLDWATLTWALAAGGQFPLVLDVGVPVVRNAQMVVTAQPASAGTAAGVAGAPLGVSLRVWLWGGE